MIKLSQNLIKIELTPSLLFNTRGIITLDYHYGGSQVKPGQG